MSVVCVIIGIITAPLLFEASGIFTVLPVGASLGAIVGTTFWIAWQVYRMKVEPVESLVHDRYVIVGALSGVVVLRWVDMQFGFVQVASEPLFWVLTGLLLGHLLRLQFSQAGDDSVVDLADAHPIDWQMSMIVVGVMILAMFGTTITSAIYAHEIGTDRIIWLLLIVVLGGHIGAYLVSTNQHRYRVSFGLWMLCAWGIIFLAKQMLSRSSGSMLDHALVTGNYSASNFFLPFLQLSFVAVVMVILVMLTLTWYDTEPVQIQDRIALAIIAVGALFGAAFYVANYTSSTLHAAGLYFTNQAVTNQQSELFDVATAMFTVATEIDPTNGRMRLHFMDLMTKEVDLDPSSQNKLLPVFDDQMKNLFRYEPYFSNTLEWQDFAHTGS